jgi:hypothetical protein
MPVCRVSKIRNWAGTNVKTGAMAGRGDVNNVAALAIIAAPASGPPVTRHTRMWRASRRMPAPSSVRTVRRGRSRTASARPEDSDDPRLLRDAPAGALAVWLRVGRVWHQETCTLCAFGTTAVLGSAGLGSYARGTPKSSARSARVPKRLLPGRRGVTPCWSLPHCPAGD